MTDYKLEDTFYLNFPTRAFATGIPTVLIGTPGVSAIENNSATPITAGITLTVDIGGVVGLNNLAIVATSANGYEDGKDYTLYIDAGTVGGVSVIGEVVGSFTLGRMNDITVAELFTTQMTEDYAADGVAPTLAQALFLIQQQAGEFGIVGVTLTVKKIDGTTTAATFTLNDDANPTSRTRET